MEKLNVLVVPSDNMGGVGFYRSTQPHIQLEKQFPDEFSVTIQMNPNWSDLHWFDKFDLVHIHKGLYGNMDVFMKAIDYMKAKGIATVMDIDDHWRLGIHHPQYVTNKAYGIDRMTTGNLSLFDYVTTTTPIFAKEIGKFNKRAYVLPNAIDPDDPRFAVNKKPSKFIRIGMIMGSTHEHDMAIMTNFVNKLSPSVKEKVQFVLCGYDLRGTVKTIDKKTGKSTERKIEPKETVWYRYEKMMTDNYAIVDDEYRKFLEMFIPQTQYPNVENEHYKRCWTKDMDHYYEHYSECDVLLAPLEINDFNYVKSQLKVIECCFSKTAIIASDYGPYTLDLVSAYDKGGALNEKGNALLVDESKNHKQWVKYITKIVEDPSLLKMLQDNLYESLHEKYDLKNVTKERAELYKELVKESKAKSTL